MRANAIACALLAFGAAGCQNAFQQFYQDYSGGQPAPPLERDEEPQVIPDSGPPEQVIAQMYTDGYRMVGMSSFNGPAQMNSALTNQARKVGASRVVFQRQHTGQTVYNMPITTFQNVTTTTTGNATAYGPGGSAYGRYSGTSVTTVPNTTYVPVATQQYSQTAMFFAPNGPPCLGALVRGLSDSERQRLETNRAVHVIAVSRGSPAFNADILPGDFMLRVDGEAIEPGAAIVRRGVTSEIELFRNGRTVKVNVTGGDGC